MTGIDLVIAIVFIVSVIVGVMRGFVREALSIASWILAIWLALTFCTEAGDFIGRYFSIPAEGFRTGAGFAVIFIGTLFLFSFISHMITKLLIKGAVKGTDRVLGIGFGIVRAAAIMVAVILVLRGMGMENTGWWQDSMGISYLEPAANYVEQLLPEQLQSSGENAAQVPTTGTDPADNLKPLVPQSTNDSDEPVGD